jgi:hypothetical protein
MPQIKTLTVNNGSAAVSYSPAGSDANSTIFVNRGSTLRGVSRITASNNPVASGALVERNTLKFDKKKEVIVDGQTTIQDVALYNLSTAQNNGTTRTERLAALNELRNLLANPDVETFLVDHESFF